MKITNIKSLTLFFALGALASCSENAWNDQLDGFEEIKPSYGSALSLELTATKADYTSISNALKASYATNKSDSSVANAIATNLYIDQESIYPADVAIPAWLNTKGTQFYDYENGSKVSLTFREKREAPAEVSKLTSAPQWRLSSANYKTVWGSEEDYVDAFTPSHTAATYLPNLLATQYPDAQEGDFVIVTYNQASENPVFGSIGGGGDSEGLTSNIHNLSAGENLSVTALVTAQMSSGLILTDNAGSILYYNPGIDLSLYPIGTMIKASGELKAYSNTVQLDSSAEIQVVGSESFEYPSPTAYTGQMVNSAVANSSSTMLPQYITVEGELSISQNAAGTTTYYNLTIPDASYQGSIAYPSPSIAANLTSGKSYKITGYFVYVSGSTTKYFNVVATDVQETGSTPSPGPTPGSTELTENIKNAKNGENLTATAVVTGQTSRGVILTDKSGSIYCYKTVDLNTYKIGTIVNVSGPVSFYNNGLQLTNATTLTVVGSQTYTYPQATFYTPTMMEEQQNDYEEASKLASFVSITGKLSVSSTGYYNVIMEGTSMQGSLIYPSPSIQDQLTDGETYTFYGYYCYLSGGSHQYFNIVVIGVLPASKSRSTKDLGNTRSVAVTPASVVKNEVYQYNGTSWMKAENADVLNPSDYQQMGVTVNDLEAPEVYLPLYMKQANPYALDGAEVFLAYNLNGSACAVAVMEYNGTEWKINNDYIFEVTALFTKSNNTWTFRKYTGQDVFVPFEKDKIILDANYLIVAEDICANPDLTGSNNPSSFGYLSVTEIQYQDNGSIIMTSDFNVFKFATTTEYNGTTYKAPAGKFMIVDSYGRYLWCKESYNNYNVRSGNAYITDGAIEDGYLFEAIRQDNGSWSIRNTHDYNGEEVVREMTYSKSYADFASYSPNGSSDNLPMLYILEDDLQDAAVTPDEENPGEEE